MNGNQATSSHSDDAELTSHLWEACVEADWTSVDELCDKYTKTKNEHPNGKYDHNHSAPSSPCFNTNNIIHWSDATLSTIIENLGEENRLNRNPLMAAVLHVAIDVAASHRSFSLFSDTVTQDLVDAEARKERLKSGELTPSNEALTTADFCPYLKMRSYGDDNYKTIDEEHRRARRKAIARLCRTNPLWILLPMMPLGSRAKQTEEGDATFDDDLPRGTTPLHVAIRSRNVTLTRLLIKYCPKSAEVADMDGCIPLHYAVRTPDEMNVLRRAVLTYQRSLNGGADNAPLEAGPNEVHSGVNLYYHGKVLFKATHESSELSRCRVRRLRRNHKLRKQKSRMLGSSLARRKSPRLARSNRTSLENSLGSDSNLAKNDEHKKNGNGNEPGLTKDCGNNQDDESKIVSEKNGPNALQNMYDTPSSLVRALMHLGTVEEDSADFVRSEWGIRDENSSKDDDGTEEARKSALTTEYPIVVDCNRTISRGLGRAMRPWKTDRHRTDAVSLLTSTHPQGMLYQCDDGGDTPLILACQTLLGDDGEDEEFGDLVEDDLDDEQLDEMPDNRNEPVPDEIGEDSADYEMDLSRPGEVTSELNVDDSDGAQQQLDNETAAIPDDNLRENGPQQQVPDNREEGPLEAVMFMIDTNGSSAMGIPDDDGDTALHAATRIGASPRLVLRLLNTMPALASTPAEDGSTPLHLACRRACHLAPEGNGGMGTYNAAEIRTLADAAGPGALTAADEEGRTPFHVACRYRASPAVLTELADSEGGRESLLIRDTEGHTPLGVYCRHATDYHGLRVLVNRRPEAAAAMGDGRHLPLHRILFTFNLAVNVDCLRLIGNAYPRGLDSVDSRGMTPLALLCESYGAPLNVDIPKLRSGRTTLDRCLSKKIWLMARYLILAARTNRRWKARAKTDGNITSEAQQTEQILHAVLRESSSSIEIVQLATVVHADQLGESDAEGDSPLHLCCRQRQSDCTVDISSEDSESSARDPLYEDDSVVFKRVNEGVTINEDPVNLESSQPDRDTNSSQRQRKYNPYRDYLLILYHILLSDMSAAGRCNNEGKYPFNLLVENGSTWRGGGVDRVLKSFPQALFSYELSNSLFAMALARTASYHTTCSNIDRLREEQTSCIGATFQLLRGKPTALEDVNLTTVSRSDSSKERPKLKKARTK